MQMFEILTGDVFEIKGQLLTVFKIRIAVVGDVINTHVHYTYSDEVKIKLVNDFCTMIAQGLNDGSLNNINRPADFKLA